MPSIRLKIEESWYASMDCKVQKSGPWVCFYGGHSTGYKLGNHPKNIEPCAHRATTPPNCGRGEGTHVPAQRAGKFFFRDTGLPTAVRKNQPLVPRSNFGGKVCARTDPWFRGQTLPVPGHGGGGGGTSNFRTAPSLVYPAVVRSEVFLFLVPTDSHVCTSVTRTHTIRGSRTWTVHSSR